MKTSSTGRRTIASEEGNILTAYQDSVGVWTIGVGHTSAAGEPHVYKGMKITAVESDSILAKDLDDVERSVNSLVHVPLTQNQFDALVSLIFNIGSTNFSKSTLLKKLNTKDYQGSADQFLAWKNAGGKPILLNRRKRERDMFLRS